MTDETNKTWPQRVADIAAHNKQIDEAIENILSVGDMLDNPDFEGAPVIHRNEVDITDNPDFATASAPEIPFYCVSIYMQEQAYGGPEEGGWWYACGTPVTELGAHTRTFASHVEARAYADELENTLIAKLNEGRRPLSSVLSTGRYATVIDYGHYPAAYPVGRPHYE